MKKTLVAIAALAAATGAMAQSSVTVYGLLDSGVYQYKSSGVADVKQTAVGNLNSANGSGYLNGSRLGFTGVEDLGNGLKAGFQLEYGINMTTAQPEALATASNSGSGISDGAALANMRIGTLSLEGGFGKVAIGTQYSYIDPASGSAGSQQANPAGGTNAAQGAASLLKFNEASIARATNGISYASPKFNGFSGQVMLNPSETVRADTASTAATGQTGIQSTMKNEQSTQYALNYANGPLTAGYAALHIKNYAGYTTNGVKIGLVGVQNDASLAMTAGSTTATAQLDYTTAGAMYDFGAFKLSGTHTTFKAVDDAKQVKSVQNGFAVSYPVSANLNIGGGYTAGTLSNETADVFKTKGYDLLAVYSLSKRTNVYGVYGITKYNTTGAVTASATNLNTDQNLKQSAIGVGLRHSF